MSRDQKPGRMRIIAGGAKPPHPLRRASDRVAAAEAGLGEAPANIAPPKSRAILWLSLLFLLCCIAGGVAVTLMLGAGA